MRRSHRRRRHERLRRGIRGQLLGQRPSRRDGREGRDRAQRSHRRGPVGHQLLHGHAIRLEHSRGLRGVRSQRHDGYRARRPGVRRGPPRRRFGPHVGGVGPAHIQEARRLLPARRPLAASHPRRVDQAGGRRAGPHGPRPRQPVRAHSHYAPAAGQARREPHSGSDRRGRARRQDIRLQGARRCLHVRRRVQHLPPALDR